MIINILILFLILMVVPFGAGLIPAFFIKRKKKRISMVYIMGFVELMALFQLIAIPVIIFKPDGFGLIVILYSVLSAILFVAGLTLLVVDIRQNGNPFKDRHKDGIAVSREELGLWIIAILLIVFQMVMSLFTQSFDGDDAYYVVESLLSVETNTLYSIKPYTGLTTSMDLRHALASVPIWIAYLSRISGIHPTIIAHSLLGFVLIPLLYMIYYQCGLILFRKERKKQPIFLMFVSIMYIFGNVSIYTNATFMMTRTWQGKSMLANMVILSITWLMLAIYDTENLEKEFRLGYWITMVLVNIVAAMCSTASVLLAAAFIGASGLILTVYKRDIQVILRLLVTCVPLVAYGAMYMLI